MFRLLGLILLFLSNRFVVAQTILFDYDTLRHKHATLGTLDTFDLTTRPFSSSFLFPNESINIYTIQPEQLFIPSGSIYMFSKSLENNLIFSALPHIGFGYSFGAQSTQKLDFDYEQTFKNGFLINAAINNFKTNGFFRNSNAQNSLYKLALARNGKKHSFQLRAFSDKIERNWNGGIQNDSLVETFSPDLIPVWKENSSTIHKSINFQFLNKFLFVSDSNALIGISTTNEFKRYSRFYFEEDSISSLYSVINLDSSKTNDSLFQQTFNNNIGMFFKNRRFNIETGLETTFWNYRAYKFQNDTLELGLFSRVEFAMKKMTFYQKGQYNFVGASNGFKNLMSVEAKIVGFDISFMHSIRNELPIHFQRFFYSNNTSYKTANLEKQLFQDLTARIGRSFAHSNILLSYKIGQFNKVYHFDVQQQIWRNDMNASQGNFHQISLKSKFNWRWLNCHLGYQYTITDQNNRFTPAHYLDSRIYIKGGIFKAKKLKALAGFDFMLFSSYKRLNFIPQMNLFDLENSSLNPISGGFMNMAFFTSFEVESLRLFVRVDNLAYLWQNRQIELVNGYTFPLTQLKIGITWDFWN
jgi:hypothetical protein